MDDFLLLLGMLIIFAAVLFLAWLTTRLLGRKMTGTSKNKLLGVVETLPVGLDRYLYLVRAGNRYFLFFASRKNMEYVSEIEIDEEALASGAEQEENGGFGFCRIFELYSGLTGKEKRAKDNNEEEYPEKDVGKHEAGLPESIQKLRNLNRNGEQHKS